MCSFLGGLNRSNCLTYRTSRGVPARLSILTTSWTPWACSNVLRAEGESTRIQSNVSSTVDVSGACCWFEPVDRSSSLFIKHRCLEASKSSSKTFTISSIKSFLGGNARCKYLRPSYTSDSRIIYWLRDSGQYLEWHKVLERLVKWVCALRRVMKKL